MVARLFGRPITRSEISGPVAFQIYRHEAAIHHLLEREAERLADERVLAEEAARRGTTPAALLAELEAGAPPVSDAEVERHLEARGSAEAGEAARPRVRHYLEERRKIELRLALLEKLRREAGYEWLLQRPSLPRTQLDLAGAPARGPETAPVTLVHFASFGSRESAASAEKLARIVRELGDRVRWIHRNFPRDGDVAARNAAEAAFAAQDAGRFWELHDALFEREGKVDRSALRAALGEAGLSPALLDGAEARALGSRFERDLEAGRRAGVLREPTVFVNGLYWSGMRPYAELRALVDDELAAAGTGKR